MIREESLYKYNSAGPFLNVYQGWTDMPPADCRGAEMYFVSRADRSISCTLRSKNAGGVLEYNRIQFWLYCFLNSQKIYKIN